MSVAQAVEQTPSADRGVENAPAVRAVELIHSQALEARASDVHLEPAAFGCSVRMRVDGTLRELHALAPELYPQVVSRLKLLAGMDIADRRQPQDGRYAVARGDAEIDVRVSSMPTIAGEKLVLRLLDRSARAPQLDALGMPLALCERYRGLVHAPYGFIVVTGPTGSGKTTTLYSSLGEIDVRRRSVCAVEDPVEMRVEGVSQVQVSVRAGLTFPTVLRSFLRQDSNVLVIGEMRDPETAAVAISAALTGQLVLTTLHSADAPRTIDRLVEMGVARHAIAAALSAILSQRLVRRLCQKCSRPHIGGRVAVGCAHCSRSGYKGRLGVFELLEVSDDIRDAIAGGASSGAIAEIGGRSGYQPMTADGNAKLAAGETTQDELTRIISGAK